MTNNALWFLLLLVGVGVTFAFAFPNAHQNAEEASKNAVESTQKIRAKRALKDSSTESDAPVVDTEWTDMDAQTLKKCNATVAYINSRRFGNARRDISTYINDQLTKSFPGYAWQVVVVSEDTDGYLNFHFTRTTGTKYKATCNGNIIYIWAVATKV
ncbi:uncharacterized protein LOC129589733 [Paramacrobiotus metropolitanus]|uniref:uncharacterized protein LOC129589733 n=1 Tax=Paramacrobiotus metropolitanus TaxID=2943436 RepID=UPI002445CCFA|nr:uncharacterized protein LOC129589733 [Paramacrobiotus metropolitanus]